MRNNKTRVDKIRIENVKNVIKGSIQLDNPLKDSLGASISGIYGQNGSGKTALIWTFELLKNALSGISLPRDTYYYIFQNSSFAKIEVEFNVTIKERPYIVNYAIQLTKEKDENGNNSFYVSYECIDYSAKEYNGSAAIRKTKILEIKNDKNDGEVNTCIFGPDIRLSEMSLKDRQIKAKLIVLQALAIEKKTSFIFNDKMRGLLDSVFNNTNSQIIQQLCFFSRMNLFVLNKNSEATYNMNLLPLSMRLAFDSSITKADAFFIGLSKNSTDEKSFSIVKQVIAQIDILLQKIVPDLHVKVKEVARQLDANANTQIVFELVSERNGLTTPLKYESEGIKKILCILSSLIAMYNDSSIFVAIDELDAGIFEYLLGEFLAVINKTGKGQLLFTSHNLRPLEVLDNSNIWFTTTNAENKYIQFKGIKDHNNLRTLLLRAIDLGGQKESVYEATSSYQIGKAFRQAGGIKHE